ncbi:hypothetical protein D3C75_796520 [compost metagenome]
MGPVPGHVGLAAGRLDTDPEAWQLRIPDPLVCLGRLGIINEGLGELRHKFVSSNGLSEPEIVGRRSGAIFR